MIDGEASEPDDDWLIWGNDARETIKGLNPDEIREWLTNNADDMAAYEQSDSSQAATLGEWIDEQLAAAEAA